VLVFANTQECWTKVIPPPIGDDRQRWLQAILANAGTYSALLAQYVRGKRDNHLMDALRKDDLMPGAESRAFSPFWHARKAGTGGRPTPDMFVFRRRRPSAINATFEETRWSPSVGVHYLLSQEPVVVQ